MFCLKMATQLLVCINLDGNNRLVSHIPGGVARLGKLSGVEGKLTVLPFSIRIENQSQFLPKV
jgi:hypothetical protein